MPMTDLLLPRSLPVPVSNLVWRSGALLVATGMALSAFGAHGLKKKAGITPEAIDNWRIASSYIIFNGLGLLFCSLHPRFAVHRFAVPAIAGGGLVFSGTILALVLNRERFRFLGPITPLGGSVMIAGYIALAL